MIKLFSFLAIPAVILAATAGIAGEPTRSFTHQGVTYVYEATPAAGDSTVLTGRALPGGARFRLIVRDGHVTGQVNRQPVSFSVKGSRGAADGAVFPGRPLRLTSAD